MRQEVSNFDRSVVVHELNPSLRPYIVGKCQPPINVGWAGGSLVILYVARCYLWLFTLYININKSIELAQKAI